MPYISKAEQERAEWMTLLEAVAHVIAADGCTPDEARQQIRTALNDNVLWPIRWADRVELPFGPAQMQMPDDTPPQVGEWTSAQIDWEAGTVLNEVSEYRTGQWRILWLDKQSLAKIWPLTAAVPDPEEERRARKWRRERWRRQWIIRFAERQRTARRWVALDELVEWCAHSATTADQPAEDRARDLAWRRLAEAILRGEFEGGGKSRVLYLDPHVSEDGSSPRCPLTQEQFAIAMDADAAIVAHFKIAAPPAPSVPINILRRCWLPRDFVRQWIERHGIAGRHILGRLRCHLRYRALIDPPQKKRPNIGRPMRPPLRIGLRLETSPSCGRLALKRSPRHSSSIARRTVTIWCHCCRNGRAQSSPR